MKNRFRIPIGLPIVIVLLIVAGFLAGPIIRSSATEQQLQRNVLLHAIPFVLWFVAVILTYITVIVIVVRLLSNNISARVHQTILTILILSIVASVIAMFQPWVFVLFRLGFHVLLVSLLLFIMWSHIVPKRLQRQEDTAHSQ
jgi:hypothetical protein